MAAGFDQQVPIAIVGMACRLPGGDGLDEFWRMVSSGGNAVVELPPDRMNRELYFDERRGILGKSYTSLAALVNPRPFDRACCPISADLEDASDIAHLKLLEVAADACRHAGLDPFDLPQRNAGVYIGHTGGSPMVADLVYAIGIEGVAHWLRETPGFRHLSTATADRVVQEIVDRTRDRYVGESEISHKSLAGRDAAALLSKSFGLNGPRMVVDAACASSMQAMAVAARACRGALSTWRLSAARPIANRTVWYSSRRRNRSAREELAPSRPRPTD